MSERADVRVWLVGAGPGDPELLTLKAARLIGEADVVLYDRLVSPEILAMARPDADLIDVGKRPGGSHTQGVLNELLVLHARSGRRVVRLKGGDPFLFGRGGEEVEVLAQHGIACEVVPGVSSSLAGPAAAGIPVTHRQVARAVTIVTGHEATDSDPVDWSAVGRLGGTLVVLMGVERRGAIVAKLVESGLAEWEHAGQTRERLIVRGQANLLPGSDLHDDFDRIRTLFDDLERKRDIAEFLDLADAGEGVRIFIGSENKLFSLTGSALVVSPYMNADRKVIGAVGVIGPTRINYGRIVPIVDYTAQLVGRLVADRHKG